MRRGKRRRDTANPPPKPHPAGGGPVFGHRVRAIGRPLRRVHAARRPVAPNTVRSSSARRRAFGAFRATGSPGQPPDNRAEAEYSGSQPENRGFVRSAPSVSPKREADRRIPSHSAVRSGLPERPDAFSARSRRAQKTLRIGDSQGLSFYAVFPVENTIREPILRKSLLSR